MKKPLFISILLIGLTVPLYLGCTSQPSGALNNEEVRDALEAKKLAVTPRIPGWLLDEQDIHTLSNSDFRSLKKILKRGKLREVPDKYFQNQEEEKILKGTILFYLYSSSEQCLGARLTKGVVTLDDMALSDNDSQALAALLAPYVQNLPQFGER